MNKDLIIDVKPSGVEIALLEDKRLAELHREPRNNHHVVGDIYLGKVRQVMQGLNAAFVSIGSEKDAFLHYLDLGAQFNSYKKFVKSAISGNLKAKDLGNFPINGEIDKNGKITQVIKPGQLVVVQVVKEAISTKGPRVSTELSFAGRYFVLVPFDNGVSVSHKIKSSKERSRLRRLVSSIKPNNFRIVIRTAAEDKNVAELDADLHLLVQKWEQVCNKLPQADVPSKLLSEIDKAAAFVRDFLSEEFTNIYVNDADLYEELKEHVKKIYPDKADLVKHYKLETPIFEQFGVDKQILTSFGKNVTIRTGIYLVIEQTEAMHVIDVNSGNRSKSTSDQEENAVAVNMEAATEIARQLRLRDMGGIIVVDFIDMHLAENRKKLYDHLVNEMAKDKTRHSVLPPGKFGLVQITRQRVRQAISVNIEESCPVCNGTGKIKSSIIIVEEIESNIKYLTQDQQETKLTIRLHPFVYSYLTRGFPSIRKKWKTKYKCKLKMSEDINYHLLEYHFYNEYGEEIRL